MRSMAPRGSARHRALSHAAREAVDLPCVNRLDQPEKEQRVRAAAQELRRADQRSARPVVVAEGVHREEARPAHFVAPGQHEVGPLVFLPRELHQAQIEILGEARDAPRHAGQRRWRDRERELVRQGIRSQRAEAHPVVAQPIE